MTIKEKLETRVNKGLNSKDTEFDEIKVKLVDYIRILKDEINDDIAALEYKKEELEKEYVNCYDDVMTVFNGYLKAGFTREQAYILTKKDF